MLHTHKQRDTNIESRNVNDLVRGMKTWRLKLGWTEHVYGKERTNRAESGDHRHSHGRVQKNQDLKLEWKAKAEKCGNCVNEWTNGQWNENWSRLKQIDIFEKGEINPTPTIKPRVCRLCINWHKLAKIGKNWQKFAQINKCRRRRPKRFQPPEMRNMTKRRVRTSQWVVRKMLHESLGAEVHTHTHARTLCHSHFNWTCRNKKRWKKNQTSGKEVEPRRATRSKATTKRQISHLDVKQDGERTECRRQDPTVGQD